MHEGIAMADNETVWESAIELKNAIDRLTIAVEQQNKIFLTILKMLCES